MFDGADKVRIRTIPACVHRSETLFTSLWGEGTHSLGGRSSSRLNMPSSYLFDLDTIDFTTTANISHVLALARKVDGSSAARWASLQPPKSKPVHRITALAGTKAISPRDVVASTIWTKQSGLKTHLPPEDKCCNSLKGSPTTSFFALSSPKTQRGLSHPIDRLPVGRAFKD